MEESHAKKMAEARQRAGTWSDSEVEELFELGTMRAETRNKARHLLQILKAIRHCNKAHSLDAAVAVVVESTCEVLECDRATLFIVDEAREQLVLRRAVGIEDIRLPLDTNSIAGSVYFSGETANIHDAYKDPRFDSSTDERSGYVTKSILCIPILDANCAPVAVLQAVNKLPPSTVSKDSKTETSASAESETPGVAISERSLPSAQSAIAFSRHDELLMDQLSLQLGVVLRNQMLREESERAHAQVLSMLDIVRSLHSNMGINSLMFTITERSPGLVDADRCTLYVIDRKHEELWSLQGAVEIRASLHKGLVGYTAQTGEVLNIEDAHKDARFNTEFDKKTGYRTKSVLVMPILDRCLTGDSQVIGVLQVINKLHGPNFTTEDEDLLATFLDIVGGILSTSGLFNSAFVDGAKSEFGAAQDISSAPVMLSKRQGSTSSNNMFMPDVIDEEDEEAAE